MSRLAKFAWFTLFYNVAVIMWGAYVRATGAGAGCGSHWPLCNGEMIPRTSSIATLVEFSHRVTSGLALAAVLVLYLWARRALTPGHMARRAAALAFGLTLLEAAVGAGLVLFRLVAENASMARALFMVVHLVVTFFLLATLALTAHWTSGGRPVRLTAHPGKTLGAFAVSAGLLLVGASGAVAALGDTLFPTISLSDALAADLSPTSHLLIRLRVVHPALAITMSAILAATIFRLAGSADDRRGRRAAAAVVVLIALQIAAGFLNVLLLAPVWLQMTHLMLADLVWIAYVIAGASALASHRATTARATRPVAATTA